MTIFPSPSDQHQGIKLHRSFCVTDPAGRSLSKQTETILGLLVNRYRECLSSGIFLLYWILASHLALGLQEHRLPGN